MKKTEKVFNEVNNGLGYIQNLNDKRNEEHQEPFLFLSAQRDEDGELPFLNVVYSSDDEILEEMILKVLEKEPEIRKAILKASRKYQEKQCLKAIETASEGFKKIAEIFNRPMPPKYPLGGLMAGKPHDDGEEKFVKVELDKTSKPSEKETICLMEDEAKRIFQSSGKLRGDEDYSKCESVIGDYVKGEKLFFFENCCINEIVIIENYDALRYALTKELAIYKFNIL